MTVTIWTGRQPIGYEADVLRKLSSTLEKMKVHCHLLTNFFLNGHEIDLFVVKPNGLFLVEMKQINGKVTGAINGPWTVQNGQTTYRLNDGRRENPYQQMQTQYRELTEWLEANKAGFLAEYAAQATRFRASREDSRTGALAKIRSLLMVYPDLHPESQLELDWKVNPVRFPDLAAILAEETPRVNLTESEIVALAKLLHLQPWQQQAEVMLPEPVVIVEQPPQVPSLTAATQHAWCYLQLVAIEQLMRRLDQRKKHVVSTLVANKEPDEKRRAQPRIQLAAQPFALSSVALQTQLTHLMHSVGR